jgi:hypothetical protein
VKNATPTEAAHRTRPISSTAHQRGAQICPLNSFCCWFEDGLIFV